jgi:hypothetical protein
VQQPGASLFSRNDEGFKLSCCVFTTPHCTKMIISFEKELFQAEQDVIADSSSIFWWTV